MNLCHSCSSCGTLRELLPHIPIEDLSDRPDAVTVKGLIEAAGLGAPRVRFAIAAGISDRILGCTPRGIVRKAAR